ncbi:hypothetical protein C4K31_1090 [Pseudomonas chlororaphis subsp. piscium]|nr:hypothetical protein C4K31_1090 [Pseudomonas chlororaphis subsp. piscium]AZC87412.1 hypothetical protein C4K29_1091 [Pseudomonas chlororaphis subsp. piscium]
MCFEAVHSSLNRPRRHPKRHARARPDVGPCAAPCDKGLSGPFRRVISPHPTSREGPFPQALAGGRDL